MLCELKLKWQQRMRQAKLGREKYSKHVYRSEVDRRRLREVKKITWSHRAAQWQTQGSVEWKFVLGHTVPWPLPHWTLSSVLTCIRWQESRCERKNLEKPLSSEWASTPTSPSWDSCRAGPQGYFCRTLEEGQGGSEYMSRSPMRMCVHAWVCVCVPPQHCPPASIEGAFLLLESPLLMTHTLLIFMWR